MLIFLSCGLYLAAQNDTVWMSEFEISSSRTPQLYSESSRVVEIITREQIQSIPVTSVPDLLDYVLNVDVRQRGRNGVQSDISIRGGSFDQTLILLNGMKMNDPQTGHHNMNIPVDMLNIERIEILEGPGARVYGTNAFSGAVNIITKNEKNNNVNIGVSGGQFGYYNLSVGASVNHKNIYNQISINKKASDGHTENTDFDILNLYFLNNIKTKNGEFEFSLGHNNKKFGANSFYTPKFPDQYEKIKTTIATAKYSFGEKVKITPAVFWRRGKDQFELFRNQAPEWYKSHNYHLTDVYGINFNTQFYTGIGKFAIGTEARTEQIISNKLGEEMSEPVAIRNEDGLFYTHSAHRENVELFAEYSISINKFSISSGLLANWNSRYNLGFFPGVDLSYDFSKKWKLFASVNKSLRLPTFTDLYYIGPNNIGNSDLKPEQALTYETGVKYFNKALKAHVSVFRCEGSNIIDWVRTTDTLLWESKNITELTTYGFETSFCYSPGNLNQPNKYIKNIGINYSYVSSDKSAEGYISKYALDYLSHKLIVTVDHKIYKNLFMFWGFSFNQRNGTYMDFSSGEETPYKPIYMVDTRLYWNAGLWYVYAEATNLLNQTYYEFGNVPMPGRWIIGGVNYKLKF